MLMRPLNCLVICGPPAGRVEPVQGSGQAKISRLQAACGASASSDVRIVSSGARLAVAGGKLKPFATAFQAVPCNWLQSQLWRWMLSATSGEPLLAVALRLRLHRGQLRPAAG